MLRKEKRNKNPARWTVKNSYERPQPISLFAQETYLKYFAFGCYKNKEQIILS